MSSFVTLFLSLIKGLRNGCSHLNRWIEEQHFLEIEALTFNGRSSDTWP